MATASVPNVFVNATPADADEVNANFNALLTFANNSTVHKDGSVAMTGSFDAGSNKVVNLAAGTASTDAVNKGQLDSALAGGIPTGFIGLWSTGTAPSDWLLCNGAAVSRTTYAALFAVIGTTFGAGDGSTTFNVPNFADRFPVGVGADADSFADSLAATGGSQDAVVVAHTHTGSTGSNSHNHPYFNYGTNVDIAQSGSGTTVRNGGGVASTSSDSHSHSVSISTEGVSGTNANLPPYLAINFIIKT